MRDGDWLIGWGCATSTFPTNIGPAAARISLAPEGKASVEMTGHEIGTGACTAVAMIVARGLGLRVEDVKVLLGDSNYPPVPVAGGSNNTASTTNVLANGCEQIRDRLAIAAVGSNGLFDGADPISLTLKPRRAAFMNRNLADYRIPVNADIRQLEVIFVPEKDERVSPLVVKGIGEIGIVGMNAAVANAAFHATGKRIRNLPVRIEDLI